jgi:hypothetical protein
MEKEPDYLLVRRKRVDPNGEWEYECHNCELWLPKGRFRGCVNYIDAYGNCLMCSSCRSKISRQKAVVSEKEEVERILVGIGFYKYKDSDDWFKAKLKQHNKDI